MVWFRDWWRDFEFDCVILINRECFCDGLGQIDKILWFEDFCLGFFPFLFIWIPSNPNCGQNDVVWTIISMQVYVTLHIIPHESDDSSAVVALTGVGSVATDSVIAALVLGFL